MSANPVVLTVTVHSTANGVTALFEQNLPSTEAAITASQWARTLLFWGVKLDRFDSSPDTFLTLQSGIT
jgi:hypothetical protein